MKRTILYCVVSSIILFIISYYLRDKIFDLFLSFFSGERLQFQVHAVNSTFLAALKLSLAVAMIPLVCLITWLSGNITSLKKRLFSVFIMIGCMVLAIMVNVFRISSHEIVMTNLPGQIDFPFEELYFEYAIAIGSILGGIISYFIFRTRKRKEELHAAIAGIGKDE